MANKQLGHLCSLPRKVVGNKWTFDFAGAYFRERDVLHSNSEVKKSGIKLLSRLSNAQSVTCVYRCSNGE